jgi:hypothetical protein
MSLFFIYYYISDIKTIVIYYYISYFKTTIIYYYIFQINNIELLRINNID